MNRRTFLATLISVPAGFALAVKASARAPEPGYRPYNADSRGIHKLLRDCGKCVEQPSPNLDEIFERIYRVRNQEPQQLYWRNPNGSLSPLNCYYP